MLCKVWGSHGGDYGECRLLGYKTPIRTSQETHYVSATESSRLMLCKVWGFHGDDYGECRPLGYKTPIRTSHETHYVSATESIQLMLCKIWGFHGGCLRRISSSGMLTISYFVFLRRVRRLIRTANFVPSSPILVILMMEALTSSDTSDLTRATPRNIPEDCVLLCKLHSIIVYTESIVDKEYFPPGHTMSWSFCCNVLWGLKGVVRCKHPFKLCNNSWVRDQESAATVTSLLVWQLLT
jgi:hypothetical protein